MNARACACMHSLNSMNLAYLSIVPKFVLNLLCILSCISTFSLFPENHLIISA